MRALKISLISFTLLIGIIAINFIYINRVCDVMTDHTEKVISSYKENRECGEKIDSLTAFWERNRKICGLSVSHPTSDRIDELIISLRSYYEAGDKAEFLNTAELLKNAIDDLGHLEQFEIDNIM